MVKLMVSAPIAGVAGCGSDGSSGRTLPLRVIDRDVCVLGAGASGMYATMRLRDLGHSVVVVEKSDRVGGHAYTYRDPDGNGSQEMGVRIYPGIPIIKDTFSRFGIPLKKIDLATFGRKYIDIRTGMESAYKDPDPLQTFGSLTQYGLLLRTKYAYLFKEGYQLPAQVPDDILQPFGDFLKANQLNEGYAPVTHYLQGFGPVRKIPTLYALKNMRPDVSESILFGNFYTPINGCSALYETMAQQLGDNVVLNAKLGAVIRKDDGRVEVTVTTPGETVRITAGKLIVSFPPLLKALQAFDLKAEEKAIFGKLKSSYYWTALVRVKGLPPATVLFNVAGTDVLTGQQFPGMYTAVPTPIPDVWNILFGSETDLTDDEVKARITTDLERMSDKFANTKVTVSGFPKFLNHASFGITVDVDDIRDGFYDKLLQLQGKRNTLYRGRR